MSSSENINLGISDINNDLDVIDIGNDNSSSNTKSVNFGVGVELLMNDKKKNGNKSRNNSDIELKDLDNLENELDDLTDDISKKESNITSGISKSSALKSAFESSYKIDNDSNVNNNMSDIKLNEEPINIKTDFDSNTNTNDKPSVGASISNSMKNDDSTWDGYKKFNDIPVDPNQIEKKEVKKRSREEILREKHKYLRKLDYLKNKRGVQLSKEYTMESSLDEIIGEYESIKEEKERTNSVKFQGKMLMGLVTGLEYLNGKFDPFDLKLDGWAESVNENIDDYDEIFGELHEKYKSKAKMAPELKLLFQLGGSAIMLHMTNTMFKSAIPGMDDIMKQNPELMQQFTSAAVNSMGQNNPNFGNFMNSVMQNNGQQSSSGRRENVMSPMGSPPGPRQPTYEDQPKYPPVHSSSRPDIGMSRGVPQFNDAENINDNYGSYGDNSQTQSVKSIRTKQQDDKSKRPEMKGPSDINELLSGIKTKNVSMNNTTSIKESNDKSSINRRNKSGRNIGGGSVISIDELENIKKDADNVPRKTKRRPRSEKNTLSFDI